MARRVRRWDGSYVDEKATMGQRKDPWGRHKKAEQNQRKNRLREDGYNHEFETWIDLGVRKAPTHDNTFTGIWRERAQEAKSEGWWTRRRHGGDPPKMNRG